MTAVISFCYCDYLPVKGLQVLDCLCLCLCGISLGGRKRHIGYLVMAGFKTRGPEISLKYFKEFIDDLDLAKSFLIVQC